MSIYAPLFDNINAKTVYCLMVVHYFFVAWVQGTSSAQPVAFLPVVTTSVRSAQVVALLPVVQTRVRVIDKIIHKMY